jgi:hypothetical protein
VTRSVRRRRLIHSANHAKSFSPSSSGFGFLPPTQKERETERQKDREAARQRGRRTEKQKDREIEE